MGNLTLKNITLGASLFSLSFAALGECKWCRADHDGKCPYKDKHTEELDAMYDWPGAKWENYGQLLASEARVQGVIGGIKDWKDSFLMPVQEALMACAMKYQGGWLRMLNHGEKILSTREPQEGMGLFDMQQEQQIIQTIMNDVRTPYQLLNIDLAIHQNKKHIWKPQVPIFVFMGYVLFRYDGMLGEDYYSNWTLPILWEMHKMEHAQWAKGSDALGWQKQMVSNCQMWSRLHKGGCLTMDNFEEVISEEIEYQFELDVLNMVLCSMADLFNKNEKPHIIKWTKKSVINRSKYKGGAFKHIFGLFPLMVITKPADFDRANAIISKVAKEKHLKW